MIINQLSTDTQKVCKRKILPPWDQVRDEKQKVTQIGKIKIESWIQKEREMELLLDNVNSLPE